MSGKESTARRKSGEQVSHDQKETQKRHLEEINEYLDGQGLKRLRRTGDWRKGEIELVGIEQPAIVTRHYTLLFFRVLCAGTGQPSVYAYQIGNQTAKHWPAATTVIINGTHLVFNHTHRATRLNQKHSWVNNVPRGFVTTSSMPNLIMRKLLEKIPVEMREHPGIVSCTGIIGQKLQSLLMREDVRIDSLRVMNLPEGADGLPDEAAVSEDDGRSFDCVHHWLLELSTNNLDAVMASAIGNDIMGIRYIPWQEAIRHPTKYFIHDSSSYTALFHFLRETGRINFGP